MQVVNARVTGYEFIVILGGEVVGIEDTQQLVIHVDRFEGNNARLGL